MPVCAHSVPESCAVLAVGSVLARRRRNSSYPQHVPSELSLLPVSALPRALCPDSVQAAEAQTGLWGRKALPQREPRSGRRAGPTGRLCGAAWTHEDDGFITFLFETPLI